MKKFYVFFLVIILYQNSTSAQLIHVKASVFDPAYVSYSKFNDKTISIYVRGFEKLSNHTGSSLQASYSKILSKSFLLGLDVKYTNTNQQFKREYFRGINFHVVFETNVIDINQVSLMPQITFNNKYFFISTAFGPQINWHSFERGTAIDLRFETVKDLTKLDLNPTLNLMLSVDVGYLYQLDDGVNISLGIQGVKNFADNIVKNYYELSYQHFGLTLGFQVDVQKITTKK